MVKVVIIVSFLTISLYADLQNDCLACHKKEQIPSELIYKRYLLKYSTSKNIEQTMFEYLKNPAKKSSIMPSAFFLKFPMKERIDLDDKTLIENIRLYIKSFDVKYRLGLDN